MAKLHGKHTVIKLGANDISQYCDTSEPSWKSDVHDVTGYGKDAHVKEGGLLDGTFSCGGTYDTTALTGPRAVILPLVGTTVVLTYQTEGTGAGKPQDVVDLVVTGYTQTAPVADMVKWSMTGEFSDSVDSTAQA